MKAVIMAGGQGTRLKEITGDDIPKPMIKICDKPILEHQLINLIHYGIKDFIFIVGYKNNVIKDYFGDGTKHGVSIKYIVEETPLGTAGALYYLKGESDDFILLFGDLMLDIAWDRFISFHKEKQALVSLFAHPNSHPFDSDLINRDDDDTLISFDSKSNVRNYFYSNLVNAGVYIVSPKSLKVLKSLQKVDFEKEFLTKLIPSRKICVYRSSEYVKDVGTPERYYLVTDDYKNGIIAKKNLSNKQKCIFVDRDGTINKFVGFLTNIDDLSLISRAAEAVKMVNHSEYLIIVITNQPVIARGEVTFAQLKDIHNKMETLLGREGAYLDDISFCPHHPDRGFEGEVPELKIVCECRKPKIGQLLKEREKFNIDFEQSYMIGDSMQDIQTGVNAGVKTILLSCGAPIRTDYYKVEPNDKVFDLYDAIAKILKR